MESTDEKFSAQWALDLLEPSPFDLSNNILKYYQVPIFTFTFGTVIPFVNKLRGLPMMMNKPYTIFGAILGTFCGYVVTNIAEYRFARRDAEMREYIKQHPEYFPEPENRKYADLFFPWHPSR
ncbi:NADH dehydrogenase [ubiquinone] 1 subunit C2 [Eufriesea mexicana]|uniref:NADH dehydrogenase [ubiquinone] 1 subunit C2 n=1 Tax=Eufriesea mexicana TaxID=516756 RepID=A0A310SLY0_9HYME|nr:PREDICTED: uncharacterized protein LOC108549875 [Eufriesea mexicana]OAD56002.1 NADH dehydrogenase [ubiquinone] 1 subunit C2 [Eufriesea mexicana]